MTLSRFLRDYVYFALGGNRHGEPRRYVNLFITMLLGGIWHGAGWTFLIWGALHGSYLIVNHGWRSMQQVWNLPKIPMVLATALTFVAVVIGWVVFRAKTISAAMALYGAMLGQQGFGNAHYLQSALQATDYIFPVFAMLAAISAVWLLPGSWSLFMNPLSPFKPVRFHLALILACWALIVASFGGYSEFLYFQF